MVKRKCVLIALLLCLVGCCASESNRHSTAGSLVKKIPVEWHHSENCKGHSDLVTKVVFEIEGHEMWFLDMEGRDWKAVVHSPECSKCNKETVTSTISEQTDYWGW